MHILRLLGLMIVLSVSSQVIATETLRSALLKPQHLTTDPVGPGEWEFGFYDDGGYWVSYYTPDQRLKIRAGDGSEHVLSVGPKADRPTGLAVEVVENKPYVAWRHKTPAAVQGLYMVMPGHADAPVRLASRDSVPLTRIRLGVDASGTTHVAWLGEKPYPEEKRSYFIYHAALSRDGLRSRESRVLPGIYPAMIVDGEDVAVFSHYPSSESGAGKIALRMLGKDGEFGEESTVAETAAEIAPYFRAEKINGRWFVLWVAQYGSMLNEYVLEGAHSADGGKTWVPFSLEQFRGADFSHIEVQGDGQQGLHLVFAATKSTDGDKYYGIHYAHSPDNGATWRAQNLRVSPNVQDMKALRPSFARDGKTLVVAWEDYRDIRPNIYIRLSTDDGNHWHEELPLVRPGLDSLGLLSRVDSHSMVFHDDKFHLLVPEYVGMASDFGRLSMFSFTPDDIIAHGRAIERERISADPERLRERVSAFWQAFVEEDYAQVYRLHDPFFRTGVSERAYVAQMGRIKYYGHEIKEVQIHGARATVRTEVDFAVPEVRMRGKTFSRERAPEVFEEIWVFVDGDWYREFRSEVTGSRYTLY
jgi:uncharacterized protein YchJ